MNIFQQFLGIASIAALTACGGGDSACGEKSQSFGIEFAPRAYAFKVGTESTITATITPESCRGDMTIGVASGAIPPGMSLVRGNVTGKPTTSGTYTFQASISAVNGYQAFGGSLLNPRSSLISVVVAP
jgi:hypothetical protein